MITAKLTFLTPLFSRGAYEDLPEIRPASIRGQLHHWLRLLGGTPAAERAIFGSVHKEFGGQGLAPAASRLVVRVSDLPSASAAAEWLPTLPHKPSGQNPRNAPNAPRAALPPGTSFTLHISERLGGIPAPHRALAERAIRAWLLAGALGLRATRGGGSFQWSEAPTEGATFCEHLKAQMQQAPVRFGLLSEVFTSAESARKMITETIAHPAFAHLSYPLGAVRQGQQDPAPSRKTSPLRLTVRRFADVFRILALWDERQAVTGNTRQHLRDAIQILAQGTSLSRPTRIGQLLAKSSLSIS